jgi:Domain of unknown function (DUF4350)
MRKLFSAYGGWIWLGAVFVVVAGLNVVSVRSAPQPALAAGSAQPDGALALNLWLQRIGYAVTISRGQAPELPSSATSATLVVIRDGAESGDSQVARDLQWVAAGGRLVVATGGSTAGPLMSALNLRVVPVPSVTIDVWQPLLLDPPTHSVLAETTAVLDLAPGAGAAGSSEGSALITEAYGRGRIWVLTALALLDNAHLADVQNRRVALNALGPPGRRIIFDEFGGTSGGGTGSWLFGTSWGVAVMFLIAVVALYRWLGGWRLGPAEVGLSEGRRSSTEYVVSMAALLRRGRSRREVLDVYERSLARSLRRRPESPEPTAPIAAPGRLTESELIGRAAAIVEEESRMSRHHD